MAIAPPMQEATTMMMIIVDLPIPEEVELLLFDKAVEEAVADELVVSGKDIV